MSSDNAALSILSAAEEVPERPALLFENGSVRTYAQVAEDVRRELERLRQQELPPVVPVVGELRPEVLTRIYALIELGYPLALLHPRWTEAEREQRLGILRAGSALSRGRPMCLPCGEAASGSRFLSATPEGAHMGTPLPRKESDIHPKARTAPPPSTPLALLFTSGTTGEPKAAVLSRRAFLAAANASADNLGWIDGDRWWLGLPLGHVGGLSVLTRCLIARRTLVIQRAVVQRTAQQKQSAFDAAEVATVVERCGVTLMSLVPTMLRRLLDLPGWTPPASLRAVLLGGAATPAGLLREARQRGVPVLTTYGLTEACAQVTTQRYSELSAGRGMDSELDDGNVGPALDGVDVRIQDGEVQVRGETLMDGYLAHSPEATDLDRSAFTADGWLRTGDLGQLDAHGRLHLAGRAKDVIISGGENVHPAEVEAVLLRHPGIAAACVFGVEDAQWGELVAAALIPVASHEPPKDENLLTYLENHLARFKLPRRIVYVKTLVVNATGKVDRRATAAQVRTLLRSL